MFSLVFFGTILMLVMMTILWLVQRRVGNPAIVDVGWAGGLAILAGLYAALGEGYEPRRMIVGSLGLLWGTRLAWHLAQRLRHEGQDGRYEQLQRNWGGHFQRKLFGFYLLQGLLDVILAMPFLIMVMNPAPPITFLEWIGVAIFIIGLVGESIADAQLRRFKDERGNQGQVCQSGLWYYSRHPNYFFEWLIWLAWFVMALASPHGYLALISPALMLYFLLKVTGIPATEAHALQSRGDAYRRYQETTSAFVPWFKG